MYIALAAKSDRGTTNLHLDVTDAVNMMPWGKANEEACATWDIFPRESALQLREFLRLEYEVPMTIDPIHSQSIYLSDAALERLASETGVRPWRILQRVGDAVFIPAGCPHQVSGFPVGGTRSVFTPL